MIRRTAIIGLLAVVIAAGALPARAEVDFVLNVLPASLLVNAEGTFGVTGASGERITLSSVYMMPNLSAGVGVEAGDFFIDVTGGAGLVVNESFRSFLLQVQVSAMYSISDSLAIGPHVGLIHFPDPEWLEDQDLEFDNSTGFIGGLQISMGDRISYFTSVDVIAATFDTEAGAAVDVEEGELSLTALAFQFGVRGEF